jgi:ppGpp synthetase/RelA/SpoT-type nucleotidyltranferase
MAWITPLFSKNEVDKAGAALASNNETSPDIEVIDNWRASHNFPLNAFRTNLRTKAHAIENHCIISQRIKRLSSIAEKLKRFKTTRLSQMQDIGGCRAVMSSVAMVKKLEAAYQNNEIGRSIISVKDYIKTPKADGYRGIHLFWS